MATYPTTPAPARVTIGSVAPSQVYIAHDGTRRASTRGGQRWRFRLEYAPGNSRADIAALHAFLLDLRGRHGTCDLAVPMLGAMRGSGAGSPNCEGPRNRLDESEDLSDSTNWSTNGNMKLLDYTTEPPDLGPVLGHLGYAQAWGDCTTSAWNGRYQNPPTATMANDNVLSCYMKYGNADRSGVNLYNATLPETNSFTVTWNTNGTIASTSKSADDGGYESVGNGWYRVWVYNDGSSDNGDAISCYVYPAINEIGTYTYCWGAQLTLGATKPAGYFPTSGSEASGYQDMYGSALWTKGWTASQSNVACAGDFVKLPGQSKLYMVARDVDSNEGGRAVLWLSSPMEDTPSLSDALDFTDLTCKVALANDLQSMSINTWLHHGLAVDLVEVNL